MNVKFSFMVTPAGLKPATLRTGIWCSIQLSYGAKKLNMCKNNNYFAKYKDYEEKCSMLFFFIAFYSYHNFEMCKITWPISDDYFEVIQREKRHVFVGKTCRKNIKISVTLRLLSHRPAFWASSSCEWALLMVRLGLSRHPIRYVIVGEKIGVGRAFLSNGW